MISKAELSLMIMALAGENNLKDQISKEEQKLIAEAFINLQALYLLRYGEKKK